MRFVCLSLGFLLALPLVRAQSTTPGNGSTSRSDTGAATAATTSTPPLQDPDAVNILNKAINAAGGAPAISAISDFTATGNITFYSGEQVQGTVTVQGLNTTEIRIDATLPTGVRSLAVHQGIVSVKAETGPILSQTPKSNVPSSDAVPFQTPLFPSSLAFPVQPLETIVSHQTYGLTNKSTTEVDGHSVYDIQLTRAAPAPQTPSKASTAPLRSRDIFVDSTSLQIIMVREMLPRNLLHEIHYSDYQAVSGVLMPFSISEVVAGQKTWKIQLSQIKFNSGLQESAFVLQ